MLKGKKFDAFTLGLIVMAKFFKDIKHKGSED